MDQTQMRRYLEDHLSGADVGLSIASRLGRAHPGTEISAAMARMTDAIREERGIVADALDRLDAPPDLARRAMGVVGSLGRLAGSLPFVPEPSLLEDLEALALGVWGKRLLWGAIGRVQEFEGGFDGIDVDELAARAEQQEKEILELRQEAIAEVLDLPA
jgi:hypothetical protein